MMTLQERLDKYGNYSTVKPDWDKFEGAEQFEVVGGNAILRDQAIKAIEKDILELIGEDDSLTPAMKVKGHYEDTIWSRNQLRRELRLKLKEYFNVI